MYNIIILKYKLCFFVSVNGPISADTLFVGQPIRSFGTDRMYNIVAICDENLNSNESKKNFIF